MKIEDFLKTHAYFKALMKNQREERIDLEETYRNLMNDYAESQQRMKDEHREQMQMFFDNFLLELQETSQKPETTEEERREVKLIMKLVCFHLMTHMSRSIQN